MVETISTNLQYFSGENAERHSTQTPNHRVLEHSSLDVFCHAFSTVTANAMWHY
jgi:hypothetical protein